MSWFDNEGWSNLIRITNAVEEKWWERLPKTGSGVYRLIALENERDFSVAKLGRVCGADITGTLYIGAAKPSLLNRIADLVKKHDPNYKSSSHKTLSTLLTKRFTPDMLAMSWKLTDDPWRYEAELLHLYDEAFGELPPRNSQKPPFSVV